ncbi:ribonuclease H-like domain-containing protein [Tanacetum coccineum]
MGKENIKEPVPHDLPPTPFLGHLKEQMGSPYRTRETVRMNENPKEIHNAKAQDDEGDMDIGWDITSKDTVQIIPPDDDFVAPATNPMSNKQLNKFEEEFSNITKVAEKEYDNPVIKDIYSETLHFELLHQDPAARRHLSRPARLIIMCELGDKELVGRRRYRFPPNFKFQSNAQGVSYMENEVDISALTMEQYIALIPDDIKPSIVNPKIDDDVEVEKNANFIRELRCKLFAGTDGDDAYKHVRTVLEIVDLFHFPGVTHDAIMLRVFPITLKGRALRWKDRLPAGSITTWDLLKKEFIWRYCHPFMNAKKLEEIYNFKQERDETLLDISTRKILDSNGFIPLMTPTQALESIQVMEDHSNIWYDETTTRERINYVLDNVNTIHKSFKGEHLTKEYPLKKEDDAIKHSKYMESLEETIIKFCEDIIKKQTSDNERMRKILENMESNIRALKTRTKNLQEKAYQLTHKVLTNTEEKVKAIMTMSKENIKGPVPRDLPPTPFLGHLKEQMGSPYRTRKTVCMNENPEEIHNAKAQDDEGDMDVGKPYIPLGPVHDRDNIVREEEQDYDIPLNDSVMQPLTL